VAGQRGRGGADGAKTNFLRVGYIPCGSPGDLISVTREALMLLVFQVLVPQGRKCILLNTEWTNF
jgi:hypothetical protein